MPGPNARKGDHIHVRNVILGEETWWWGVVVDARGWDRIVVQPDGTDRPDQQTFVWRKSQTWEIPGKRAPKLHKGASS